MGSTGGYIRSGLCASNVQQGNIQTPWALRNVMIARREDTQGILGIHNATFVTVVLLVETAPSLVTRVLLAVDPIWTTPPVRSVKLASTVGTAMPATIALGDRCRLLARRLVLSAQLGSSPAQLPTTPARTALLAGIARWTAQIASSAWMAASPSREVQRASSVLLGSSRSWRLANVKIAQLGRHLIQAPHLALSAIGGKSQLQETGLVLTARLASMPMGMPPRA